MSVPIDICILAAGIGSRMKSNKPKVLQTLAGRPFLAHQLDAVSNLEPRSINIVIGQGADEVKAAFSAETHVNWVFQAERLGTGHAMQQVVPHLSDDSARVLILLGDAPLVRPQTLQALAASTADLTVLTVDMPDPFNYGRIERDGDQVLAIVEEKDADEVQRQIHEINSGFMSANAGLLKGWLSQLSNDNAQQEYLLTDIVAMANQENRSVAAIKSDQPIEVTGVNTFAQLAQLERDYQMKTAQELMDAGVQLMDPARLDVRGKLTTGKGVRIDVNVVFEGEVSLADDVSVGANCIISDSTIGAGSVIKPNSVLEGATVGAGCSVGPFARLRPGAVLSDEAAVGNFVEVKKATLGQGAKASHLAYLGDATIGAGANIGAGTITCNYDGVNKHQTEIGDGAFIGSNSALVAPVSVGAGATVGAGSTITKNVADNELALGRGKQKSIANWQRPTKKEN